MTTRRILYLPTVSLSREILSERARALLESLGEVTWNPEDRNPSAAELAERIPGFDVVVTSWGSPPITEEALARADRLRVVGHAAGSVKHLVPEAGYRRGIIVLSAAAVIADAVAEYTLWAMLSMQRDLYRHHLRMTVEKAWRDPGSGWGHELYRKKVGIIAASMVGRRVIRLLQPFACDIMVYDPYLSAEAAAELGVRRCELLELMREADIVSVHAPTTPETKEMLRAEHFVAMKDGALFINTARAWVLDEDALLAELRKGRIRAVLDVYGQEPLPRESPFRDLPNVLLTPHVAGGSTECRARLVEAIAEDLVRVFAGEKPRLAVTWERLQVMA
jgi:phosphoglycerate dehydrogenase-like enzyme